MLTFVYQELGGAYKSLEKIGEGGMGAVYRAERRDGGETVAIKFMHESWLSHREAVRRFEREGEIMSTIRHPNVMPVFEQLDGAGFRAIVMPYLTGGSLLDWSEGIPARGENSSKRIACVIDVVIKLLDGLDALHQHNIVHRDIKPENILMGDGLEPIICDLGIARDTSSNKTALTREAQMIGTAIYMSPEQHVGKPASVASDIYAVGMLLFELLSARLPYTIEEHFSVFEVANAHLHDSPKLSLLPAKTPSYIHSAIATALAKDPARRWESASEFAQALGPRQAGLMQRWGTIAAWASAAGVVAAIGLSSVSTLVSVNTSRADAAAATIETSSNGVDESPGARIEAPDVLVVDSAPGGSSFEIFHERVNVDQYVQCVKAGVCSSPEWTHDQRVWFNFGAPWREYDPVNGVSFAQAIIYCNWKGGMRLPTQREWEVARDQLTDDDGWCSNDRNCEFPDRGDRRWEWVQRDVPPSHAEEVVSWFDPEGSDSPLQHPPQQRYAIGFRCARDGASDG